MPTSDPLSAVNASFGPVRVRPARPEDAVACATIFTAARRTWHWQPPESTDDLAAESKGERQWVAVDRHATVTGFASVWIETDLWFLHHLFVDPDRQGLGIGAAILQAVVSSAEPLPVELKTSTQNVGAIRFYQRHGFVVAERPAHAWPPWIRLRRPLVR